MVLIIDSAVPTNRLTKYRLVASYCICVELLIDRHKEHWVCSGDMTSDPVLSIGCHAYIYILEKRIESQSDRVV